MTTSSCRLHKTSVGSIYDEHISNSTASPHLVGAGTKQGRCVGPGGEPVRPPRLQHREPGRGAGREDRRLPADDGGGGRRPHPPANEQAAQQADQRAGGQRPHPDPCGGAGADAAQGVGIKNPKGLVA